MIYNGKGLTATGSYDIRPVSGGPIPIPIFIVFIYREKISSIFNFRMYSQRLIISR
jgi:hypothetical protein